ncbi:MAG: hypothetical protein ACXACA_07320, partial [Candidatus Ranarchaeia archaeon]
MIKFVFPDKDSFVSSHPNLINRNFGIDEVLEIGKRSVTVGRKTTDSVSSYVSRALLKFDLSEVSKSIVSGKISEPEFDLVMNTVEAYELPLEYEIIGYPISQSWEMGIGRLFDDNTTQGVSWKYRDEDGGQLWDTTQAPESSAGGGNWLNQITSNSLQPASASMELTVMVEGQPFYVTGSDGTVYTFTPSSSVIMNQIGYATASIDITAINEFDQFTISASKECQIIVVNNKDLQ